MKIDLNPEGGGVLIAGDADELLGLSESLREVALEGGSSEGFIFTAEAVETVRVVRLVGQPPYTEPMDDPEDDDDA